MTDLNQHPHYYGLDSDEIIRICDQIANAYGDEFTFDPASTTSGFPPAFIHKATGFRFRYLPGGTFRMGLSEEEEADGRVLCDPMPANLQEMRPVTAVRVDPFLIAERPVLNREAGAAAASGSNPDAVAYMPYEQAEKLAARWGFTLPAEAQWEYACRAGTATLFPFGRALPSEEELESWLVFDFTNGNGRANRFGLYGLFVGEWCRDRFTDSYEPEANVHEARVVRGGGAYFWPWQDHEWVWCMSAMRCPSTDLPEGECAVRLVRNFPDVELEGGP